MESVEVTNVRTPEQDERFAATFKNFLREYLNMSHQQRRELGMSNYFEVDISDPKRADMEAILGEGNFDVKNIVSSPRSAEEPNVLDYSFYAGKVGNPQTEIHVMRGAADVLTKRLATPPPSEPV